MEIWGSFCVKYSDEIQQNGIEKRSLFYGRNCIICLLVSSFCNQFWFTIQQHLKVNYMEYIYRQHCHLSICSYFGWVWQLLWRPPESGCGIFEEPQLSENWLQLTFFDGWALLYMSINFWICFWCTLFAFQQLRRTFLPAFLFFAFLPIASSLGKHSYWSAQKA